MSNRWFRYYDGALDDPKVQSLPGDLFKAWVNLLCIASRHDGKIPEADLCFMLRLDGKKASKVIGDLITRGLLDRDGDCLAPHNWVSRQFKSDVSNERVKRHRKRQGNGECNVTETATETPPETDTETEEKGLLTQSQKAEGDVSRATQAENPEITEAFDAWDEAAGHLSLPKVQRRSPERKRSLALRLTELGGIEGWRAMIEILGKSPHLLGENDRAWRATFDWILKPANLTKVMEGNYVRAKTNRPNSIAAGFDEIRASIESGSEQGDPYSPEDPFGLPRLRQGAA